MRRNGSAITTAKCFAFNLGTCTSLSKRNMTYVTPRSITSEDQSFTTLAEATKQSIILKWYCHWTSHTQTNRLPFTCFDRRSPMMVLVGRGLGSSWSCPNSSMTPVIASRNSTIPTNIPNTVNAKLATEDSNISHLELEGRSAVGVGCSDPSSCTLAVACDKICRSSK